MKQPFFLGVCYILINLINASYFFKSSLHLLDYFFFIKTAVSPTQERWYNFQSRGLLRTHVIVGSLYCNRKGSGIPACYFLFSKETIRDLLYETLVACDSHATLRARKGSSRQSSKSSWRLRRCVFARNPIVIDRRWLHPTALIGPDGLNVLLLC